MCSVQNAATVVLAVIVVASSQALLQPSFDNSTDLHRAIPADNLSKTSVIGDASSEKTSIDSTFQVRLVDGLSGSEGRLEVRHYGTWGTVCQLHFDDADASVACKMLGYRGGGVSLGCQYGRGEGPIWLSDVYCKGTERTLQDCRHEPWGENICCHSQDVSIKCRPAKARLVGGSELEGRLEIYHDGVWGTVCGRGFDSNAANVACRMMQYRNGGVSLVNRYGPGSGVIWMADVGCAGTEESLERCAGRSWGSDSCTHEEDISVRCNGDNVATSKALYPADADHVTLDNMDAVMTPDSETNVRGSSGEMKVPQDLVMVRLVGGLSVSEGRLEVRHDNVWGTVCDNEFDDVDASVACKMLGYRGGGSSLGHRYGPGSGTIWLSEVACIGTEGSIKYCRYRPWGENNCDHSADVSIKCYPSTARLVDSRQHEASHVEGRLEIYRDGVWATVCEDGFDNQAANVACRMMNYLNGGVSLGIKYSPGQGLIGMADVCCTGQEQSLEQCAGRAWGENFCTHNQDVSIKCNDDDVLTISSAFQVRLVDGPSSMEGRLEVRHKNIWGTVCANNFTDIDAGVACKSLGYRGGGVSLGNRYGRGSGVIWMTDVHCTENHKSLAKCQHAGWGVVDCNHGQDVSISCHRNLARMVGDCEPRSSRLEGRLQVYHNGTWGTVCDDAFDNKDARVACRMMQYWNGGVSLGNQYGPGSGTIWMSGLRCTGNELSLDDCHHQPGTDSGCVHAEDISVKCIDDTLKRDDSDDDDDDDDYAEVNKLLRPHAPSQVQLSK